MINICILALRNAILASVADPRYVFILVNEFLTRSGKDALFEVKLVGMSSEVKLDSGLFALFPDAMTEDIKKTDLVIIPALAGAMMPSNYLNIDYAPWISKMYKNGAEVAALSTGAFLMAYSGLLKGKHCTTHWSYANEFRYVYPSVMVVDERLITDQDGLYSSGGGNAYWNLLLHLVEKYAGREMAILAAKYFVVDLDKNMQSPFIVFNGLKDHEDHVVLNAQGFIEKNYYEKLTVGQLADQFNVTRRTFERRFKKATRNTVAEYIQRVKVEATRKQLEIGRKTITEIMHEVGYADIQTFREVFKKITGLTPTEYRDKYN
ncbi:MAG TPA: helix-turn-helix domain-containing protein [Puia sp.]|nr:helix-turn-helix domain-containing protein [Puia sp.]